MMNNSVRVVFYGIITWLVPFLIAIPFYSPGGQVLIDRDLFKSIMIVCGAAIGAVLIVRYFRTLDSGFFRAGCILGGCWLVINWALDLLILVPLGGYDLMTYGVQIGIRYLTIPIMTGMAGMVGEQVSFSLQNNNHE